LASVRREGRERERERISHVLALALRFNLSKIQGPFFNITKAGISNETTHSPPKSPFFL
jgi:hypothetical protein